MIQQGQQLILGAQMRERGSTNLWEQDKIHSFEDEMLKT